MTASFFESFAQIQDGLGYNHDASAVLLQAKLSDYLSASLTTIRDAKRLAYTIDFYAAASNAAGDVSPVEESWTLDLVDLASYHALRLFDPGLVKVVSANFKMSEAELGSEFEEGHEPSRPALSLAAALHAAPTSTGYHRFANIETRHLFLADPAHEVTEQEKQVWAERLVRTKDPLSFSKWLRQQSADTARDTASFINAAVENSEDFADRDALFVLYSLTSGAWSEIGAQDGFYLLVKGMTEKDETVEFWNQLSLGVYLGVQQIVERSRHNSARYWDETPQLSERVLAQRLRDSPEPPLDLAIEKYDRQQLLHKYCELGNQRKMNLVSDVQNRPESFLTLIDTFETHCGHFDWDRLTEYVTIGGLADAANAHRSHNPALVDPFISAVSGRIQSDENPKMLEQ